MTHFRAYLVARDGTKQSITHNAHPEPRTSIRAALDDFLYDDEPEASGVSQSEWVANHVQDGAHIEISAVEAGSRQ